MKELVFSASSDEQVYDELEGAVKTALENLKQWAHSNDRQDFVEYINNFINGFPKHISAPWVNESDYISR